jgi:class 3 adenylate cyclase
MYRSIAKYVLRAALFASAVAAIACASPTAPAPVNSAKAVKDSVDANCRSGYTIIGGRYVCNDAL